MAMLTVIITLVSYVLFTTSAQAQTILVDRTGSLADQAGVEERLVELLTAKLERLCFLRVVLFSQHVFSAIPTDIHIPCAEQNRGGHAQFFGPMKDAQERKDAQQRKSQPPARGRLTEPRGQIRSNGTASKNASADPNPRNRRNLADFGPPARTRLSGLTTPKLHDLAKEEPGRIGKFGNVEMWKCEISKFPHFHISKSYLKYLSRKTRNAFQSAGVAA